ncbi:hypothetical protein SOVF_042320 [Spinacia oleracea]|nr:hypothetical protein SOVF_042320 [Spinacia oleracea]
MDVVEFQESEVMFSDYSSDQSMESNDSEESVIWTWTGKDNNKTDESKMVLKRRKSLKKTQKVSYSLPIHIPGSENQYSFRYDNNDDETSSVQFDQDSNDDKMWRLPPHLIVDTRRANKDLARSFPLKQRNLYYVRNCIIRMNDQLS